MLCSQGSSEVGELSVGYMKSILNLFEYIILWSLILLVYLRERKRGVKGKAIIVPFNSILSSFCLMFK